jgi:hypothetical protein
MRGLNVLFLFSALTGGFLAPAHAATAAGQTHDKGRTCTVADRGGDIWFGFFKGRQNVFAPLRGDDDTRDFSAWRCFASQAACDAWSAVMTSDHPVGPATTFCRKGG